MTERSLKCHERRQGRWPVALALALLLTACGGGDGGTPATDAGAETTPAVPAAPLAQKGFGPTELYDPATNPTGHVLQNGDTGIVFVPQGGAAGTPELQAWFEIARASTYAFEMEDEDLVALTRVDVGDAAGQVLLSVDAAHRLASATLTPGRYALRLIASANNPETMPLFIRFGDDDAQMKQPAATGESVPRFEPHSLFAKDCVGCNLRGVNLSKANLSGANLSGANLSEADLEGAWLPNASLESANLSGADLGGAILEQVNLSGANLTGAYLSRANLRQGNLSGANLTVAYLPSASMYEANLGGANLSGAFLLSANLSGANLAAANLAGTVWVDGRACGMTSIGQCQ